MQHADYVRAIEFHGAEIARAARLSLDAPVRACGSWRVADLLWHVGEVHRFWTAMALSGTTTRTETLRDERPEEMDMIRWYEEGVSHLVSTVSTLSPDQPCWTWAGPQNIAWLTKPRCMRGMPDGRRGFDPRLTPNLRAMELMSFCL